MRYANVTRVTVSESWRTLGNAHATPDLCNTHSCPLFQCPQTSATRRTPARIQKLGRTRQWQTGLLTTKRGECQRERAIIKRETALLQILHLSSLVRQGGCHNTWERSHLLPIDRQLMPPLLCSYYMHCLSNRCIRERKSSCHSKGSYPNWQNQGLAETFNIEITASSYALCMNRLLQYCENTQWRNMVAGAVRS